MHRHVHSVLVKLFLPTIHSLIVSASVSLTQVSPGKLLNLSIFFFYFAATCSSDQHVKIWDRDPATNTWKSSSSWKSHSGSVWKVTWAHPEFGQIVATCSFDRTAVIWEEASTCTPHFGGNRNSKKYPGRF